MMRRSRYVANGWLVAALLTVISFMPAVPVLAQEDHAQQDHYAEYLNAGTAELGKGDFYAAKADFEAAVQAQPENPLGWYEMGVLYGRIGDFKSAETAFRRALQFRQDLPKAHYMLGLSLIANPQTKLDWPGAIAEFQAALKIQPGYAEARTYLGVGLTATGQTDRAIAELQEAVRLAPHLPSAHFNLAIALENGNRLDEAAKEYRAAIAAKGDYAEASSALGKLLSRMGKGLEAEEELRNALRLNPDLQDAHYALAHVLKALKRPSESRIELDQAVNLGHRGPNAVESSQLSNLAMKMASTGDIAGAETSLLKAIMLRPDYGVPHYNLGLILADKGEMERAAQQLTEAISLLPGQAMPWFDLGRVQRRQGKVENALMSLSWAVRLAPSNTRIQEELQLTRLDKGSTSATVMEPLSNVAEPATWLKEGRFADTTLDHFNFAKKLTADGEVVGAVGQLLRSLTLQPTDVEIRGYLANSYEQLGNLSQARLEYEKVLLLMPNNAGAHMALGKISLAQGRPDEAVEEFRRVLTYSPDSVDAQKALLEATRETQKH